MTQSKPLKIVIVGAGMVGAFAAVALSNLPNVEVSIYEKSPERREAGAALTFTESSLVTLAKVLDINDLQKILWRAPGNKGMTVRHWKTGEYISEKESEYDTLYRPAKSQRIQIHKYILDHVKIPINYNYYLENIELIQNNQVQINFKDKEPVIADLLVAADGIYSKIRRQFTNDEIVYKGAVAYRNVFDEKIVSHIKNLPNEVTVWVGPKSAMFMTPLKPGLFNVAAHLPEPESIAKTLKWNETSNRGWEKNRLIEHFKDWDPLIGEILEVMPESYAFPLEKAPWLTNLAKEDRIAFVGDAAHPTSGVYGAGAGIGFDDVWALFRSLQEIEKVENNGSYNLRKALKLFSNTRTHFLQRVVEQMDIDKKVSLEYVAKAKNDEEWTKRVKSTKLQAGWISKHNVETEFQNVRDKYFLEIYSEDD